jgi:hypothetical protein
VVGDIRAVAHLFRDGAQARDELDSGKVERREREMDDKIPRGLTVNFWRSSWAKTGSCCELAIARAVGDIVPRWGKKALFVEGELRVVELYVQY